MKSILTITLLVITNLTFGQSNSAKDTLISNPTYDKTLAEKLGGDDYGMKSYFLVILKTGKNTSTDKELIAESFRGHMNNINRLVAEGKLIVAGPLGKNDNKYRGIFILNNLKTIKDVFMSKLPSPHGSPQKRNSLTSESITTSALYE